MSGPWAVGLHLIEQAVGELLHAGPQVPFDLPSRERVDHQPEPFRPDPLGELVQLLGEARGLLALT
jgi:hypothetical protein